MSEDLLEITETATMSREAAAAKLRAIADQLSKRNALEFTREGIRYTAKVPDKVQLTIEIEIGEENELEIEITW